MKNMRRKRKKMNQTPLISKVPVMSFSSFAKYVFAVVSICTLSNPLFAQIEVVHIPKKEQSKTVKQAKQAKVSEVTPLVLPFWDDFSTSTNFPDTSLWLGSQNVSISAGVGVNPPSFNVATFDGADANGNVYSSDPNKVGLADSLLSKPIDLSNIISLFQNNVYISFFWQLEGKGEIPDPEDSIRLQFKDVSGSWQTVWSMTGGNPDISSLFQQEFVKIDPLIYFSANFQFKFESFSRLSGIFDTWQLDYILVNVGRDPNVSSHPDRALTSYPTSLFGNFTALPASQFFSPLFPSGDILSAAAVGYFNLENQPQPINFSAIVRDTIAGVAVDTLNLNQFVQPVKPLERAEFNSDPFEINKLLATEKSALALKFYIDAEDTLLIDNIIGIDTTFTERFDLKSNDTITTYFHVDDYFAYDDGTAEFGAGINQNGGQLAYLFELFEEDTLTGIDIYFPNIGANFAGTPIELRVWKDLDGSEDALLVQQPFSVKQGIGINELQTYQIEPAVVLNGAFYIGYRQSTDQRLTIGLDKNTDTGQQIFFNVSGGWTQNTDVSGSLMMRPRFANGAVITGIKKNQQLNSQFKIFPNPSPGKYQISGEFDSLVVFDMAGRIINARVQKQDRNNASLDVSHLPNGIYQVRLLHSNKSAVKRIIVQK